LKNESLNREHENELFHEMVFVTRTLLQRGGRSMEELGIGMGQLPILELLQLHGTMTQRQLADEIRVTPATISGTLKRMEKAGVIHRSTDENDARVSKVSLTDEGTRRCDLARQRISQQFWEAMDGFGECECGMLRDFIRRMGENLKRSQEASEGETNG